MGFFLWPPLAVQPFVSMSILLASCFNHLLGGTDADFCVMHVSGMMFHFTVSTKDVGFYIYRSCSFECQSFEVFFSLWGSGGPNWRKNYDLWIKEEAEWTTILGNKFAKKSFVEVVQSRSVFKHLHYPSDYFSTNFDLGGRVLRQPYPTKFKFQLEMHSPWRENFQTEKHG